MLIESNFEPAFGLRNPHLQTIFPSLIRSLPKVKLTRERIELVDGDFLDLDWGESFPGRPAVLVLHGLEGSSQSNYAAGILAALAEQNFNAVLMHSRGCSGEPNRLLRRYHAGATDDMATIAKLMMQRFDGIPLFAVGYSLGANALLKWLGESGVDNPLSAAVAVSVPFDLSACATRLESGWSRIYQYYLLRKMQAAAIAKKAILSEAIDFPKLKDIKNFTQFDHLLTAPTHGFASAAEYYRIASCKQYLRDIKVSTLIIQSLDDPFMYAHSAPTETDLSKNDRKHPYWLEHRIPEWFGSQIG